MANSDLTSNAAAHSVPMHAGKTLTLSLAALGVVFGDIGTSPLYAFREAMSAASEARGGVTSGDVLGLLSLIVWALVLIVTVKYVLILMRADNEGEGGTLSLFALAQRAMGRPSLVVLVLGLLGASLFYGDAVITPAVSVLSAVEGLTLITPAFDPYVVPIAVAIIVPLFLVQNRGTAAVARFFGPVTLIWFIVMAAGGIHQVVQAPEVLAALNPLHAVTFLASNGVVGLIALGAVFLAVTGAEALYADMGHFGRRPIQLAWLIVALPALLLNYFGQGALVLANPEKIDNPFFQLYPEWALLPVVLLATVATIIASQAVITGAFSLTRQAMQLRLFPRMLIRHTSVEHEGQIYLPGVNLLLLVGVLAVLVSFGSSSALAAAYGISVTGTMVVSALLAMIVAHRHWGFPLWLAVGMMLPFLAIDLVFLGANMLKLMDGGYLSLSIAGVLLVTMWTWRRGTDVIMAQESGSERPLAGFVSQIQADDIAVVSGTAIYPTVRPDFVPTALLQTLNHFRALHEHNVVLNVTFADVPRVAPANRVKVEQLAPRLTRICLTFGYAEDADVPRSLLLCEKQGWKFDMMSTSFILSRRVLRLVAGGGMPLWQGRYFIYLVRNSANASDYFRIPAGRAVEIGTQVDI